MEQMGIGSIEPHEGMASLQMLVGHEMGQMAVIKTLNSQATAGLNLSEVITYYPSASERAVSERRPHQENQSNGLHDRSFGS
jgi:hypothetical protein